MTANREWVKFLARWMAKIHGSSAFARLGLLGVTGISTLGSMLKDYGYSEFFIPVVSISVVGYILFAHEFAEGGVWNQVSRDQSDMSRNYATPFQKISNEMTARGIYAGKVGRELTEGEREAIRGEITDAFNEMRDGVDIDD